MDTEKIKILAIDDNLDNLITIQALTSESFPKAKIMLATSGKEGLQLATKEDPDVILLDIVMPEMDGFEVCKRFKADKNLRDIPVVFVTALKGDKDSRIKGLDVGAEAFLAKPIDESELMAQIRAMVKIKAAAIQKRTENERLSILVTEKTNEINISQTATLNLMEDLKKEIDIRRKSEDALRESEARLTRAELASKSGNWELNIDTKIVNASIGAAVLYGVKKHTLTLDEIKIFPLHEYRSMLDERLKNLIEKNEPYTYEFKIKQAGTDKILDIHSEAFYDRESKIVFGVIQDVTQEKAAKDGLKVSEEKYRNMSNLLPQVVFELDSQGIITYVNKQVETMFGYVEDEMIGKSSLILHHPEDVEKVINELRVRINDDHYKGNEYEMIRKDNTTFPALVYTDIIYIENKPSGFRGLVVDISERKKSEVLLRESEEKFREMANLLPQVIFEIDLEGTINYVNRQAETLFGYEMNELIGTNSLIVHVPEEIERVKNGIANKIAGISIDNKEFRMVRKDGSKFPALVFINPIVRNNQPVGVRGVIVDITEQKLAEEKIVRTARMYLLQSQINQAIVKSKNLDELFQTICDVAIEYGQLRMGWIGIYDEVQDRIIPFKNAGYNEGYIENLIITPGEKKPGIGPTGLAFHEGKMVFCNDIATDMLMAPWKDEALKRGYNSSYAAPLFRKNKPFGSINLYSAEANFFSDDEQTLLQDISKNISYAIDAIDSESERLLNAEALEASETKYRELMDNSPEGITIYVDAKVAYINKAALRMIGATNKSELMGKTIIDFIHPDNIELVLERMKLVAMAPINSILPAVEEKYIRLDGTEFYVEIKVMPILYDGKPAIQLVGHDISDRKLVEQALEQSRIELKTIYDNAPVMMCVVDQNKNIQFANHAFLSLSKYNASQLIGGTIGGVIGCIRSLDDPRGCGFGPNCTSCKLRLAMDKTLKNGKVQNNVEYQATIQTTDGTRKVSLLVSIASINTNDQKNMLICLVDITDRKISEEALQKSETLLRSFIDNSPFEIWARNNDFVGILENKKFVDHHGTIIGIKTSESNVDKQTIQRWERVNKRVLKGEIVEEEFEFEILGEARNFQQIVFPIKNEYLMMGIAGFNIDITDRLKTQLSLNESQEQLIKFAAHLQNVREEERVMLAREIHDDLGQILIAIKIDLGLLKNSVQKQYELSTSPDLASKFNNLNLLVDNTIKSARRIMTDLRPEVLDLLGFIDTVKQYLKSYGERFGISYVFDNNTTSISLTSQQAVALFRIVQEALNNIAKHAKASKVTVKLNEEKDSVILKITDNGVGFDYDTAKRVDSYGLLGMKERVYLLNGDLSVESKLNHGTSIIVKMNKRESN